MLCRAICSILLQVLAAAARAEETVDVLIQNGLVYDGSGATPVRADVAVKDQRIAAIGAALSISAKRVIDASGLAVAPGFIDPISVFFEFYPLDGRAR